jgi:hypothetical protein
VLFPLQNKNNYVMFFPFRKNNYKIKYKCKLKITINNAQPNKLAQTSKICAYKEGK